MRIIVTNAGLNVLKEDTIITKPDYPEHKTEDSQYINTYSNLCNNTYNNTYNNTSSVFNTNTRNAGKKLSVFSHNAIKGISSSKDKININTETEDRFKHMDGFFHRRSNSIMNDNRFNTLSEVTMSHFSDKKDKDIDYNDRENVKRISVNQNKIKVPKSLIEKYNKADDALTTQYTVLPTLPASMQNLSLTKRENSVSFRQMSQNKTSNTLMKQSYNLKEIIPRKIIKDLKRKLKSEKVIKEDTGHFDLTNFRTKYNEKDISGNINENLIKEIEKHNINFIKYINSKDKISDLLLKQITTSDEHRICQIDKVCHTVATHKELEHLDKCLRDDKITYSHNFEKKDYRQKITNMKKEVTDSKQIIERYGDMNCKNEFLKKQRYKEIWKEIKKGYWDKHNVDHINREKGNMFLDSSYD